MARTIEQISAQIKTTWMNNAAMRLLFNLPLPTSGQEVQQFDIRYKPTSLESRLVFIVASAFVTLENMFDWHKEDVINIIENERYGYAGWYVKKALLFRFGVNLMVNYTEVPTPTAVDGDFAENLSYPTINPATNLPYTDTELYALQVVKYAHAADDNGSVLLKVAGSDGTTYQQLNLQQENSLKAYINRIKPAGIVVFVRNQPADNLYIKAKIRYNPLVLAANGSLLASPNMYPVNIAIKNYINSLNFNGELSHQALEDAMQAAEGVELVGYLEIQAGVSLQNVEMNYVPYSGYMKWDENNNSLNNNSITYISA